jgi:hypothetical protein
MAMQRWRADITAMLACVALLGAACTTPPAPAASPPPGASQLASSGDAVQDKNFYLLTVLDADDAARATLTADAVLAGIGTREAERLKKAYGSCAASTRCLVEAGMMPAEDIMAAGDRLAEMAVSGGPLHSLVTEQLRPSGRFHRHAALDDSAFIRAAWTDTAEGLNRLYRVYGLGEKPRYPAIDSPTHEMENSGYRGLVRAVIETWMDGASDSDVFFTAWMRTGLDLLVINQRDESGRYEPMETGVNAAAFSRARTLDWSAWSYSAILVPGAGTLENERGLSAAGALRVRLAARRYHRGLAPFLIVSGGHVHPNKTPYAEAIEMKRELVERYDVPEYAVVVDPHARHTTTNLRNGVRLMHAMGAPADKDFVITTSRDQSFYIQSPVFTKRNDEELGYQPATFVSRLTPNDTVARPNLDSLHADPQDPLDP